MLDKAVPHAFGREAVLLPSPLTSKDPGRDVTDWMDTAVTPPGVARIGLAHGSVRGFGSDDTAALRLAPDRAKRAGLSYLALGDWHGVARVSRMTRGTPARRSPINIPTTSRATCFRSCVDGAKLATVEKLRSSEFTWVGMDRAIHSVADLATVERDLEASALSLGKTLVRLTLTGHLSLTERAGARVLARSLGRAAAFPRSRRQGVGGHIRKRRISKLSASPGSFWKRRASLPAIGSDADSPQQAHAATALLRLAGFAAEARHEAKP